MGYGYLTYYVAIALLTYLVQYPPLLVGLVVLFLLRRFIPDPWVLFRTFGRISTLRRQIDANPQNVTARRDLAVIYLERLRPGAALELVQQALKRFPDDAELLYLEGLALHRKGRHEQAIGPLVKAVQLDPRVRFGQPYLVAGDALTALGRHDEAVDSYERFVHASGSSIEGHVKLARALKRTKDAEGHKKALDEAFVTWRTIPGYARRKQLGWWLRAHVDSLVG
jgi:tetratricopeptide (TPR) repeat protein